MTVWATAWKEQRRHGDVVCLRTANADLDCTQEDFFEVMEMVEYLSSLSGWAAITDRESPLA